MDWMKTLTEIKIVDNELWRVLALFGIILLSLILGRIIKFILINYGATLEKRERFVAATTLSSIAKGSIFLIAALGITFGISFLHVKEKAGEILTTLTSILTTIGIGYMIYWLIDVPSSWLSNLAEKSESKLDNMLVPLVRKGLRISLVVLIIVQILQILSDKPITSIIAGLGIGGLAVALAAQDTLKNIFGSVILFVDKPFELGDRVVVDSHDGPVEEVGLRSTKIRTLEGHLVTVPNGELANKTIQNIGKRHYIRRVANITITYDTPPEMIDRALEILKELLENHEGMNPDFPPRVFFNEFNADSLNIMVIYWYHPPDYWSYMTFCERFNKEVFRRFNEEGIDFAFPTQTIYLAGDSNRPLSVGIQKDE